MNSTVSAVRSEPATRTTDRRLGRILLSALVLSGLTLLSAPAQAEAESYDFKDPKGVNALLIIMDSVLEPIVGMANGISGTVSYDPENPESLTGEITLDVKSIKLSNDRMTQVMFGAAWINAEKFGTITVKLNKVTSTEVEDGELYLMVDATIEAMGKSLKKEIELVTTHVPDGAKKRGAAEKGDLLRLASEFVVTRQELGIKPEMGPEVVADEILISVAIAGYEKVDGE